MLRIVNHGCFYKRVLLLVAVYCRGGGRDVSGF